MVINLVIPEPTPSINRIHGYHWTRKRKERQRWGWLVKQARLCAGVFRSAPSNRVRLTIRRFGPRMLDHDNFVAGTKFLQDAIVAEGFVIDDKPAHLEPVYSQHVGKPHRTEIRIEEIL
jgi:Holliday junction resolvase RusA-like endonuclease